MGSTEERKIQNKLAQRRSRAKRKGLTGHEGLAERNRRACPTGGVSSNSTAQSHGDWVQEEQSTLVPHPPASSVSLDTTNPTDQIRTHLQNSPMVGPCT
ncbi:hypothetical protein HBI23_244030 [Parastagonospora nodorum]|nr:hypothetical protein HBH97_254370 [Parastagonospora nodorum]KAH5096070.1 hypothetical protein HBH71_254920 [Parastagonospora nodorum]KAH5389695.1 hypothetical protein HBI32_250960 [Parastagonospora nodorum]KAH5619619.1 hypothetical protein HBI23_244030 [Parastagonospora nodorum]KAH5992977.1 hypothetical protein HBI83_252890 [Parastagonospora nodorum]